MAEYLSLTENNPHGKKIHQGRNVKRFREMLGIKQDALAFDLGLSQQAISALEQKEALDKEVLEKVAKAMQVPAAAIENFDEEAAINIIGNTFSDNEFAGYTVNHNPTFNPLDKLLEQVDKIEQLYKDLLRVEREKIALLERMLDKK